MQQGSEYVSLHPTRDSIISDRLCFLNSWGVTSGRLYHEARISCVPLNLLSIQGFVTYKELLSKIN